MTNLPHGKPPPWMRLAGVGVEYAAAVAGLGLIGWWIDQRWQTKPWGVLIGATLGLIGGTYNLIRSSMAAFKDQRLEQGRAITRRHERKAPSADYRRGPITHGGRDSDEQREYTTELTPQQSS